MEPLVSILVPAYNSQAWIAETLRSALGQQWPRKEIIVVDDGSQDHTLAIARRFECDCLRVVSQKRGGPSVARNTAYSLSRGDYIQWLDADDLLAPDKIVLQMQVAQTLSSRKTLLSSAWGQFLHRYDRTAFVPTGLWQDLTPVEWLLTKLQSNVYMTNASWLVSRELTEAAGPWDPLQLRDNDGEYFCRVLLRSDGVKFVPSAKMYYRVSGGTSVSTVGHSAAKLEATWRSLRLHVSYLRSLEDSPRTRAACIKFLQDWLLCFYPERLDIVEQAQVLASALGGRLTEPRLSWKYSWMRVLFGWRVAKHAQAVLPRARWSLARHWDKVLSRTEQSWPI